MGDLNIRTLQQLKEEARKEMSSLLDDHEIGFGEGATTTNILNFIDSLITKAYEEGKRENAKCKNSKNPSEHCWFDYHIEGYSICDDCGAKLTHISNSITF